MKIISYGDSHARATFSDIVQIEKLEIHGRTMNRICKEGIGKELLGKLDPKIKRNIVIFCFGEIDIRCHVHKQIHEQNRTLEEVLISLANTYVDHISFHSIKYNYDPYVMSVLPPCDRKKIIDNPEFPCLGTNEERALYTFEINNLLSSKCINKKINYLDVHFEYKDENSLLNYKHSDGNVHIKNTEFVKKILREKNLIT